jgi:arylsulfatase A-like enzyme
LKPVLIQVCCPSRSELLTGRYFHNIRDDAFTLADGTKGCMHVNVTKPDTRTGNPLTFSTALYDAGYATGVFGKYMNDAGMEHICAKVRPATHSLAHSLFCGTVTFSFA